MKFLVTREACCSQDDQIGPLEMVYDLADDITLQQLVEAVATSKFLQFSSTHAVMAAHLGNDELVRVFGNSMLRPRPPAYARLPNARARDLIGNGELHFRFVFS